MAAIRQPLTNLQLELLKAFSYNLDNQELIAIKKLLADFFAQRSIQAANRVWDEEGWNEEKVNKLLETKLRTPYKKK